MKEPWSEVLLSWIPHQRWFAGKGLSITTSWIAQEFTIAPGVHVLVIEVAYREKAEHESYQVPVVIQDHAPAQPDSNYIGSAGGQYIFDGVGDPRGSTAIFRAMQLGTTTAYLAGSSLTNLVELAPRAVTTEQSNSSIVFGNQYIMKVFRRLWPGRNPDLALNLELAGAGNTHVARPLGWLTASQDHEELTLALVQEFHEVAGQGWHLATSSLGDRLATARSKAPGTTPETESRAGLAFAFAEDAYQLGAATAQVHRSLAERLPTGVLTEAGAAETADRVLTAFRELSSIAPGLNGHEDTVNKLVDRFRKNCWDLPTQRIHNDLHLTQVLKTPATWVLIDFEGEPNIPITRRDELGSPLRDIACMLRSFDYAAYFMLDEASKGVDETAETAETAAVDGWLTTVRASFVDGYQQAGGKMSSGYVDALLLFELEKALFEIDYEYNNRPSWFHVATESTYRLLLREIGHARPADGRR